MEKNSTFTFSKKDVIGSYLESLIETLSTTSTSIRDTDTLKMIRNTKKLKQPDVWKKKCKKGIPKWQRQ